MLLLTVLMGIISYQKLKTSSSGKVTFPSIPYNLRIIYNIY